jgi:pimeloyl-ACP methyl ester carboxylesterase
MRHERLLSGSAELAAGRTDIDRETVLFVNAVGMPAQLLEPVASAFDAAGLGFLTWELRGSPGPTADPADSRLEDHVSDGLHLLDALDLRYVHLAGWCTGAPVALSLTAVLGHRALSFASVDGAFLFSGVPGGRLGNAMFAMCGEIVADERRAQYFETVTRPRDAQTASTMGMDAGSPLFAHVTLPYRSGVDGLLRYAHAIRAVCAHPPEEELRRIRCPALFTARRNDLMVAHDNSRWAAELVPGARFRLFDDGGHYGLFEDPAGAAELTDFMRSARQVPAGGCS